jgi:predicted nucleic acid-binding protein
MRVVVDASAVAAIALDEPDAGELANYLDTQTLVAPTLIDYELANIGVTFARRHPGRRDDALAIVRLALKLRIARVPVPMADVLQLAIRTGLTAYDASYLWLAQSRDAELVSLDKKLMRVWHQLET